MSVTPVPSENEDDFDIYGDLSVETLSTERARGQSKEEHELLRKHISQLLVDLEVLRMKNGKLMSVNRNLSVHISSLYNTAVAEVQRKDKTIDELRKKIDDICFRRSDRRSSRSVIQRDTTAHKLDVNSLRGNLKHQQDGRAVNVKCEPEVFETNNQSARTRSAVRRKDSVNESKHLDSAKGRLNLNECSKERNFSKGKYVTEVSEIVAIDQIAEPLDCAVHAGSGKTKKSVWERIGFKKESFQSSSVASSDVVAPNKGSCTAISTLSIMTICSDAKLDDGCDSKKNREEIEEKGEEKGPPSKNEGSISVTENPIQTCHDISKNEVSIRNEAKVPVISNLSTGNFPSQNGTLPSDEVNVSLDGLGTSHTTSRRSVNEEDNPKVKNSCSSSMADFNQSEIQIASIEDTQLQATNENETPHTPCHALITEPQQQSQNSESISSEYSLLPFKNTPQRSPSSNVELSIGDSKPATFVHPPLPKEDPAPLPPLPLTSPPPTPLKEETSKLSSETNMAEPIKKVQADHGKSIKEINAADSSSLKTVADDRKELSNSLPLNTSSPSNSFPSSNENLFMQCPFKPRRRAKSIVVLEDVPTADIDESTMAKTSQSSHVPLKRCKSPESKFKRTPLKKYDVHENRLASDYRYYQMQRSVYSSRHLSSVKSFSHVPERRSPSELLNGRSGRIVRLAHEDKIRSCDRRSQSLSPNNRNVRQIRYHTRNVSNNITSDLRRRNFMDERQKKSEKKEDCRKPKTQNLRKTLECRNEKESKAKSKSNSKMAELFGESSPEPEEKACKSSKRNSKMLNQVPKIENPKSSEITNNQVTESVKIIDPQDLEEEHIVVKRRPRSSIHLGNSENCSHINLRKIQDCSAPTVNGDKSVSDRSEKNCINKPHQDKVQTTGSTGTQLVNSRDRSFKRSLEDRDLSDGPDGSKLNSKLVNFNNEVQQGRPFKKRK